MPGDVYSVQHWLSILSYIKAHSVLAILVRILNSSSSSSSSSSSPEQSCNLPRTQMSQAQLLNGLVNPCIKQVFTQYLQEIYDTWVQLRDETTLAPTIASNDEQVVSMLKSIHCTIADTNYLKSRLGHVQLTNFMAALKIRVLKDRQSGRLRSAKRSDTIAMDLFVQACGGEPSSPIDRTEASKRIRISKRWADLASGGAPLLIIAQSEKADRIVADLRYSNDVLRAIALEILNHYPPEIIQVANSLNGLERDQFGNYTKDKATHLNELNNMLLGGTP